MEEVKLHPEKEMLKLESQTQEPTVLPENCDILMHGEYRQMSITPHKLMHTKLDVGWLLQQILLSPLA